jgi:hypothetical protein
MRFRLRVALFTLLLPACLAHGEVVRFTHNGVSVSAPWNEAGGDFQPAIEKACSQFQAHSAYENCAKILLNDLLAADLRLWNARDGKNLTWLQRPLRLMPTHLQDRFTHEGKIQHLRSYTDQSQPGCDIHQPYASDDIELFIETVRAQRYGPSYPEVDFHIYQREIKTSPCKRKNQP